MANTTAGGGHAHLPHIQVIGSLNIDLVTITPRVPEGGETLTATSFATHPGGKGANQAVACARASRRSSAGDPSVAEADGDETVSVSMVGAVGRDTYADLLVSTLKQNGVKCDHVSRVDTTTGVATILVEESSGQNRILFTPGANKLMQPDLVPSLTAAPKPDLIVMQHEIPIDTVLEILKQAKAEGIDVLLNPAPALKLPDEALQGLTHLILNETEAAILCDLRASTESENLTTFLDEAFNKLTARGVQQPIITLGSKGVAFLASERFEHRKWEVTDGHRVPKVVDTTAAGDTFVGYYAVGFVKAKRASAAGGAVIDLPRVIAHANRAAALTVTKAGAMESIPFMNELQDIARCGQDDP